MNNIDAYIEACANYMSYARPDLWNKETAAADISRWVFQMSYTDINSIGTGGFVLTKESDDPDMQFCLSQQIVDLYSDGTIFRWTYGTA
jgi:hypothetical protein